MKKEVDKRLRGEQAGFRQECSCVDQIATLTLRIIIEQTIEWQTRLYLSFIDFQKAFDSVDHQVLWKILRYYGVPHKIISSKQQLYKGFTCQIIHVGTVTDPFPVSTGVRQGCLLSPLLFLLMTDWVSRTAYSSQTGIQWTLTSRLEDLDFADDVCSLSHRLQDSQHQATRLETTAKRTGLCINAQKTKAMRINANQTGSIKISNTEVENVQDFTYFGSVVSTSWDTDEDIKSVKLSASVFGALKMEETASGFTQTSPKFQL